MINNILIIAAAVIFLIIVFAVYHANEAQLKFYVTGLDSGFKISEIKSLWKLSKEIELQNPQDLYESNAILNHSIASLIQEAKLNGTENSHEFQSFLEKLYKFRTKLALDHENKRGLESSKYLDNGQRLRVVLKGYGVFHSKIINNGRELIISMPRQFSKKAKRYITVTPDKWENKEISIYLWRKGDACYAFDTKVFKAGYFRSSEVLFVRHSYELSRIQKRQSIRCACQIYAQLYIITSEVVDYNVIETESGYRCLIEDISEDGAMIRIGGKGENNVQLKLQFDLNDSLIVMFGVVRAVEYNSALNQSRLHFECTHIDSSMHNKILSFVYNILPQEQKDFQEAIDGIEKEESDVSELEEIPDEDDAPVEKVSEQHLQRIENGLVVPEDLKI